MSQAEEIRGVSARSQSTPSWFGALIEAFAEEAQQAVECAAVVGRRLQDLKPMLADNSVRGAARHRAPGALQGLFERERDGAGGLGSLQRRSGQLDL
jgi:hypothetical protein